MAKLAVFVGSLLISIPFSAAQLDILAQLAGKKYFGTATDNPELTNASYVAQLGNTLDFHQLTPANSMKWDATEPSRGIFTFNGGDAIVAQAKSRGQLMREAINDDGTFRQSVFFNTTGLSYIKAALRTARKADPKAKLYINDFNIEGTGAKSTTMINLVKELKSEGVPIDGIGVQSHLIVGEVPTTMQENLQAFADLGVEVAITELDIRMTLPETPELLEQQTKDYEFVISACKAVKGCVGVTLWDWTDKFSWVPGAFAGQGGACPWDEVSIRKSPKLQVTNRHIQNFKKKPAYLGIVKGWLS
uniref:Beta-xylanase n=1 Tax=Psilocybe cubensis TaxID=181762 RepID=A0A8H7Y1Z0_PSICU